MTACYLFVFTAGIRNIMLKENKTYARTYQEKMVLGTKKRCIKTDVIRVLNRVLQTSIVVSETELLTSKFY